MSQKKSINNLRDSIKQVDEQISNLFNERQLLSKDIAKLKIENNLPITDIKKEREILDGKSPDLKTLYSLIMMLSKKEQSKVFKDNFVFPEKIKVSSNKIGFAGLPGSFTQIATKKIFPKKSLIGFNTFEELVVAINNNKIKYGVLPIENNFGGPVKLTYDLLNQYPIYIVLKQWVKIKQVLAYKKDTKLKEIKYLHSNEEAFKQCSNFINKEKVKKILCENTSIAMKEISISNKKDLGAIGSEESATTYGLKIDKRNIMNSDANKTAFVVLSKNMATKNDACLTSLTFILNDKVGALSSVLLIFSVLNINLKKLESQYIKDGTYRFYVELEGNLKSKKVLDALSLLKIETAYCEVLGSYNERSV